MFEVLFVLLLFMRLITSDYSELSPMHVATSENVFDSTEKNWAFAEPIVSRYSNATSQAIEPRDFLDVSITRFFATRFGLSQLLTYAFEQSVVKGICLLSELKDRTGERSNYTQYAMLGASGWERRACDSKPSQYSTNLLTNQVWADGDFECQWWTVGSRSHVIYAFSAISFRTLVSSNIHAREEQG